MIALGSGGGFGHFGFLVYFFSRNAAMKRVWSVHFDSQDFRTAQDSNGDQYQVPMTATAREGSSV